MSVRVQTNELERRLNLFSQVNRVASSFYNANPVHVARQPIDLNNEDVFNFLKGLHQNQVKYLLVGGFAMAFHGYVRATQDLGLWIRQDDENISRMVGVLKSNGVVGIEKIKTLDLIPGFTQFKLGSEGFVVDPMKYLKAFSQFDFDSCYERSNQGEFKGIIFWVINPYDLLKEKESTNLPKDQGEFLRNLLK